jgi:uncharacterized membrane protein YfhO
MLGILAACLAPFHDSRRYVFFLIGLAIAAGAIAYGIQPVRWLVVHLPIVKAMKNGRLNLVLDFAIAALAGLGISAAARRCEEFTRGMRHLALALIGIVFLAVSFGVYKMHLATLTPVALSRSPLASLMFLTVALVVLAVKLRGHVHSQRFAILAGGLAIVEMLSFSYGYLRFASVSDVFPSAAVLDFLRSRDQSVPFRVTKDRVPIPHNAGMIYGFESADGYDLTTERTRLFAQDLIEPREDGIMFLAEKIVAAHDRRLDMLNVKYLMVSQPGPEFDLIAAEDRFAPVFSQRSVAVFENKTALPRFFAVPESHIEVIPDPGAQLARVKEPTFDPERSVIFSAAPGEPGASNAGAVALDARVQLIDKGTNGYRLRVDSNGRAVLVISQMYYPGWKATIDGSAVEVYPVNFALTGIVVPAGVHEIRVFFRPDSFRIGLMISLVSVGIGWVLARIKPRIAEI